MKIEIPNVAVIYPNEDTAIDRTLSLESEPEYLQINFLKENENNSGGMSLEKSQVMQLRDALNLIIKNKLLDD
jgi:hypothetical protein